MTGQQSAAHEPGMSTTRLAARLAAIQAQARRRVPAWQPWMRQWCTETNWGEQDDATVPARNGRRQPRRDDGRFGPKHGLDVPGAVITITEAP